MVGVEVVVVEEGEQEVEIEVEIEVVGQLREGSGITLAQVMREEEVNPLLDEVEGREMTV
jgi:hypothetical protein